MPALIRMVPWHVGHARTTDREHRAPPRPLNPMAVKRFIQFKNGELVNTDPGMDRTLCGLGLGFFKQRLAGGPFGWDPPGINGIRNRLARTW